MLTLRQGTTPPEASVTFTACDQAGYVAAAVNALLAQQGIVLELLLSDDASSDGTLEIIRQTCANYAGPHTVRLREGRPRLGLDHFGELAKLAQCDFQIMAHADDIAEPNRCARLKQEADRTGASVVSSNGWLLDEHGQRHGLFCRTFDTGRIELTEMLERGSQKPMLGAFLGWRREIYTRFPLLNEQYLPYGHDTLLCFRGALLDGMHYLNEPLLNYRRHEQQWSNEYSPAAAIEIQREAQLAHWASLRRALLRDVQFLREASPGDSRQEYWRQAETLVRQSREKIQEEWLPLRDQLRRGGLRATWIPREEYRRSQTRNRAKIPIWASQYWELFKQIRWKLTGKR